jgi:hypothetical protein
VDVGQTDGDQWHDDGGSCEANEAPSPGHRGLSTAADRGWALIVDGDDVHVEVAGLREDAFDDASAGDEL